MDRDIEGLIKRSLRPYESRFEITYLTDLAMPEMIERLRQVPKQTVVLYGNIQQDQSGTRFLSASQALPRIVNAASAPVFVFADTFIGSGAVGGFVASFGDQGRAAGRLALSVLKGERPPAIQSTAADNVYMFDWRALQRWGLSEKRLPPGSAVLFRQPTFWQSYGLYIMGAVALGLAQTLVIAGLLSQRTRRRKVEQSIVQQLKFEGLLSDLSTTFINLPEKEVDANIGKGLERIAKFMNVERITLYEFSSAKTELTATCWTIDGNQPAPKDVRIDDVPHWTKRLLADATLIAPDPRALPDDASLERQYLQRMGIRSAASVPLKTGSEIIGAMTFGSTTRQLSWTPDVIRQLKILAEVFSNAVARKRSMQALLGSIAELKTADAVLRESEERFRLVANSVPVLIWMSGVDKLCTYFNKPWLDFVGRPMSAELGDGWVQGVHPEDVAGCLESYTQAFDCRERFSLQYRLRRHDGEYRWMLDMGVPRFDREGVFEGYIGSCSDVTERKLAEEALATLGGRLMEAQEQERTRIARELHDDINQRLALLAIELQRLNLDSSADIHARSEELFNRTVGISGDVQALSHQLHSSKLEFLGLVAAIKGFCAEFAGQQPNVTIAFDSAGVPAKLPHHLSLCLFRVLQEALRNAVRHSGVPHVEVRLEGTSSAILLTIRDRGRAFDPEVAMQGRGLGLISMRERVHLVKGTIHVTSRPQWGTEISVRVPVDAPAAAGVAAAPARHVYGHAANRVN
jgi:PAS domain S-box-containing protein